MLHLSMLVDSLSITRGQHRRVLSLCVPRCLLLQFACESTYAVAQILHFRSMSNFVITYTVYPHRFPRGDIHMNDRQTLLHVT